MDRRDTTQELRNKILSVIKRKSIRMLIFDEIQNLMDTKHENMRDVLNGLKALSNRSEIPIILVGTELAEKIIDSDGQVADRYPIHRLPRWEYDIEFRKFLGTLEMSLPLKKPSHLSHKVISERVYLKSGGSLGQVVKLVINAAVNAILDGSERITMSHLRDVEFPVDLERILFFRERDLPSAITNGAKSTDLLPTSPQR